MSQINNKCVTWRMWGQWAEKAKDRSPHDSLPENQIIKRQKSDCLTTNFHPRGSVQVLYSVGAAVIFLFPGSTLNVNWVQFTNHKHLVKFSYMIYLWTKTIWLCLGNTKLWLCLGTTNTLLHLQSKQWLKPLVGRTLWLRLNIRFLTFIWS